MEFQSMRALGSAERFCASLPSASGATPAAMQVARVRVPAATSYAGAVPTGAAVITRALRLNDDREPLNGVTQIASVAGAVLVRRPVS